MSSNLSQQKQKKQEQEQEVTPQAQVEEVQEKPTESFFARLKRSLSRTKANIGAGFFWFVQRQEKIDDDLFEELEEQLLIADVGIWTPPLRSLKTWQKKHLAMTKRWRSALWSAERRDGRHLKPSGTAG